jgi:hypothetical protein
MNLVIQFISNIITTVFTLSLLFIGIIVVTLMILFLLPIGCIGCILKTKSIKNVPRYIKKVVAGVSDETDEFFYHIANSLKHTWRV